MVGRFSAVTGPLLWGLTTYITVERGGMRAVKGQAFAICTLLDRKVRRIVVRPESTDDRTVIRYPGLEWLTGSGDAGRSSASRREIDRLRMQRSVCQNCQ